MAFYNRVVLMGNLTRNPEVRVIPNSDTSVARTSIAVNRKYKDKEEAMFIDIVAYGRSAEIMGEFLTKGSSILVEGRLSMNSWEQDGVRRTKHEVVVDNFQMIGSRKDRSDNYNNSEDYEKPSSSNRYNDDNASSKMIDDDDVPF